MSRVYLGITDEEFLLRTPHEICLLMEMRMHLLQLSQVQAGLLRWTYANAHRDPEKHPEPFPVEDFVSLNSTPSDKKKQTQKRLPNGKYEQDWRTMLNHAKMVTAALGGYVDPRLGPVSTKEAIDYLKKS